MLAYSPESHVCTEQRNVCGMVFCFLPGMIEVCDLRGEKGFYFVTSGEIKGFTL